MKFQPTNIEIASPLALQELDDKLGTQTQEAYRAAVEQAPHLNGLAVVLDDKRPHFKESPLGLGGSHVAISSEPEFYRDANKSGIVASRMGAFSKFFRSRGEIPVLDHLIVSVLLHEIGHANDFAGYIQRASGDAKSAFALSRQVRKSQLATLPLKAPSSAAQNAWDNNTKGYRDKLLSQGMTPEVWSEYIAKNSTAYGELPCEAVADRFALGVLATTNA